MEGKNINKVVVLKRDSDIIDEIKYMIYYAIDHLIDKTIFDHDTILIKPNLMYYWDSSTGETTDPLVVKLITDKIMELFNGDVNIKIIESDASAMRTKYAFRVLGYDKIQTDNIELVNLSQGQISSETVDVNNKKIKIKINKVLKENPYIINVPKIKVHRNPPILSCALKNNFGLISTPYKYKYHKRLQDYIIAINKLVKTNLVIIDGLVMLGKHPRKMGVIIGGNNPLSCDIFASKICGLNLRRDLILSKFIANDNSSEKYELLDPEAVYTKICKEFPRVDPHREKMIWDLELFMLDTYSRLVGDIKPPVLE